MSDEFKEYLVVWEINVSARSPREAAEYARAAQRDPGALADAFEVHYAGDSVLIHLDDDPIYDEQFEEDA